MEEREIKKKLYFLESLPLFNQIHRRALHEYIYYFKVVEYKWKDLVYSQDEEPQNVYIIKSGEFILQKFCKTERSQNSVIFPKTTQVAIIGPGEIFGEVDCLLEEKSHFSVRCNTQLAEVYTISKKVNQFYQLNSFNLNQKITINYIKYIK